MLFTLSLGGKERPILFGQTVFRLYKQETGNNLLALITDMESGGDLSALSDIVYWALRVGEISQKVEKEKYTPFEVGLWLDENPAALKKCLAAFFDSIKAIKAIAEQQVEQMTAENGEAKKKNLPTKTTGT